MKEAAITKDEAAAAAGWWRQKLVDPKFDNLGPTRGRDATETASCDMASMLATMAADRSPVTNEILDKFYETLAAMLEGKAKPLTLSVDYGPDRGLAEAAKQADVDCSRFPWKTHMWIASDGRITARHGYGAPEEEVYAPRRGAVRDHSQQVRRARSRGTRQAGH